MNKNVVKLVESGIIDQALSPNVLTSKRQVNSLQCIEKTESKILKIAFMQYKSTREIAKYLGISQPSVVWKLKKYGISRSN